MYKRNLRLCLSLCALALVLSIITSMMPRFYNFIWVFRQVSYFLTISVGVFLILYLVYIKQIKQQTPELKKTVIKVTLIFIYSAILVIVMGFQQTYIQANALVPMQCVYLDDYDNLIYRSDLSLSCPTPVVMLDLESEKIISIHETRVGQTNYVHTQNDVIGSGSHKYDFRVDVVSRIHVSYDDQMRLTTYKLEVMTTSVTLYNTQYYHSYHYKAFELHQVYEPQNITSTQTLQKSNMFYEVFDQIQIIAPPFETTDMRYHQVEIYEMTFNPLSSHMTEINIKKSTSVGQEVPSIDREIAMSLKYLDNGYRIEAAEVIHSTYPHQSLSTLRREDDSLSLVTTVTNIYTHETGFEMHQGAYRPTYFKPYIQNSKTTTRYRYYQKTEDETIGLSRSRHSYYFEIIKGPFGKQVIHMAKQKDFDQAEDIIFHHGYPNEGFDYVEMLFDHRRLGIYLRSHPVIEYAENNMPNT